jgi:hypothetical protein
MLLNSLTLPLTSAYFFIGFVIFIKADVSYLVNRDTKPCFLTGVVTTLVFSDTMIAVCGLDEIFKFKFVFVYGKAISERTQEERVPLIGMICGLGLCITCIAFGFNYLSKW